MNDNLFGNLIGHTLSPSPGEMGTHVLPLFALAMASPAEVLIETGVRAGHSTYPLLAAAYLSKRKLISLDIAPPQFKAIGAFAKNWNFRQQDALEFLNGYGDKIGFIFLDDCHDYYHVKEELEIVAAKIDRSSIILIHDTMAESYPEYYTELSGKEDITNGGPARAVLELDKDLWEYATLP